MDLGVYTIGNNQLIPIRSVGDTLGLTTVIKEIYNTTGLKSSISTLLPSLFDNNPYVSRTYLGNSTTNLFPCIEYKCNIIQNYFSQLPFLHLPKNPIPEIYLSSEEVRYAKEQLKEFGNKKKIAVCLNSSADSRDLKYNYFLHLLKNLKQQGYILISVGNSVQSQDIYHKSFVNQTTLRQVFSLINECDLYLGVDTGLFHVAAALNIPQFVFFRNNGCSNNAYHNTQYLNSLIQCPEACFEAGLVKCSSQTRCMDMFDLDQCNNLILKNFPL